MLHSMERAAIMESKESYLSDGIAEPPSQFSAALMRSASAQRALVPKHGRSQLLRE